MKRARKLRRATKAPAQELLLDLLREINNPQARVVHRYLSLEFREGLRRKAYQHQVNADFRRRSDGTTRFPKELTETPLFQAIQCLCRPGRLQPVTEAMSDSDRIAIQIINDYVTQAICGGEPGKVRDLATMLELHLGRGTPHETKHVPWLYFTGTAALAYLDAGVLPTKGAVITSAIERRAFHELWLSADSRALVDPGRLVVKIEDIRRHRFPRHRGHIFRVLDLIELPT